MSRNSLATRAAIALLLMLGFYVLALGIAGGLLYLPYAEWTYAHRIHPKLALICLLGAGSIVWAILPRRDRFEPPGPALGRERFPSLFARLEEVARRTRQTMPRQVFLVGDLNAWVASRGGFLGLGSERVMGIGWPLLQALSVPQLEAVLAHEFGHYHGGDTWLGPWIYRTRAAIGRTLGQLDDRGWLQLPFRWYGWLFVRLTHAVSRAQEFAADRLAAEIAGPSVLIAALRRVHACSPAFDAYWAQQVAPVLRGGYRTPLAHGFSAFLRVDGVQRSMATVIQRELAEGTTDPFDTHPSLRDRIAALDGAAGASEDDAGAPAIELLGDLDAAEALLLSFGADGTALRRIDWDDVPQVLLVPSWRQQSARLAPLLDHTPLEALPAALRERQGAIIEAFIGRAERQLAPEELQRLLTGVAGCCLALTLVEQGFTVRAGVGEPISLQRGETRLAPFTLALDALAPQTDSAWRDALREAGVAGVPLKLTAPK